MLDRIVHWYLAWLGPARDRGRQLWVRHTLSCDAHGIRLERRTPRQVTTRTVAWHDIVRVVAYRGDVHGWDAAALAIALSDGSRLDLDERMDGWPELLPRMHACLAIPTPAPVWLLQVTTAVGPEQPCVVYERPPPLLD